MDPIAALCLSVPPSLAFIYAVVQALDAYTDWRVRHAPAARGAQADIAAGIAETMAKAIVESAKWQAGAKKVKVKDAPADPTPFETWMADEGYLKPKNVQDAVDWALGIVMGTEGPDDMGRGGEEADEILRTHAMGMGAYARAWQTKRRGG